ncbi:MAG: tryptophan synthase subunit alpha [Planctomycetes bacterium]|nr:tryptophan synthase subunit alpha [Planctomycetota bacterium]
MASFPRPASAARNSPAPRTPFAGSPLSACFSRLLAERRPALIPYFMAGFPSAAATRDLLARAVDAGADVLELGSPFSDPLADGPAIQQASHHALENGMTLDGALRIAEASAARASVPIVLMTYVNVLLAGGFELSLARIRSAGVAGLIIPDLSLEAGRDLLPSVRAARLDLVQLAAPTSPTARLRALAGASRGFLYMVSVTGVTGVRASVASDLEAFVARARRVTELPLCVGFGVAGPEQAARIGRIADGVVIGSALVKLLREADGVPQGAARVQRLLCALRRALPARS